MKRFVEETDREQGTLLPECMEDCGPFAPGPRCNTGTAPVTQFSQSAVCGRASNRRLGSLLAKVIAQCDL